MCCPHRCTGYRPRCGPGGIADLSMRVCCDVSERRNVQYVNPSAISHKHVPPLNAMRHHHVRQIPSAPRPQPDPVACGSCLLDANRRMPHTESAAIHLFQPHASSSRMLHPSSPSNGHAALKAGATAHAKSCGDLRRGRRTAEVLRRPQARPAYGGPIVSIPH